jgi:UDP-sugar pyrophosphorylase
MCVTLKMFLMLDFVSLPICCRTINVEYNQLDPLLRSSEAFKDGDVNDSTGFSPFPGNINQLLFNLEAYNKIMERTKGVMPDFVNPKYADETKTVFKKPTRLECMMQDFPTVLESDEKVGFTQVDASLCFSPVKNSVADGMGLQAKGIAAGTAATGEADQYAAARIMMRARGCKVEDAEEVNYGGIKVVPGPAIVLKSDFVCCPGEYNIKFPYPEKVKISARSTLVVRGPGVTIESLDLDGALVIDIDRTERAIVRDLVVKNDGWVQVPDPVSKDEKIAMRGFKMDRKDARYIEVKAKDSQAPVVDTDDNSDDGTEYLVEDRVACGGLELGPSVEEEDFVAARSPENTGCSIM